MKENFRSNLEKAVLAKESLNDKGYCTISVEDSWQIKVYAHPNETKLHQVIAALTSLTGKLEKKQEMWGTAFEFVGENDSFDVRIKTPEQCKIVGYKIEKRPKKVFIESSEIETVKTPVTDCDFRAGRVKAGDFEPLQAEVVA